MLAWLSHCPDIESPTGPHAHPGHHGNDAGTSEPVDAGGEDAGTAAMDAEPPAIPEGECETGDLRLYTDDACDEKHLAEGIQRYVPRFPLWSDGAAKDRYIFLPEGSTIDTSNVDRWTFPKGTRLYKTFIVDGLRIETRVLEKLTDGVGMTAWQPTVYLWSADQRSAIAWTPEQATAGVKNAIGTLHDVPSSADCTSCHTMKLPGATAMTTVDGDIVNGFSAIQLNWDPPEELGRPRPVTLDTLLYRQRLRNGAGGAANIHAADAKIPGGDIEQKALGYLHANCGHCHGGASPRAGLSLWVPATVRSVEQMPAVETACGVCLTRWYNKPNKEIGGDPPPPYVLRIVPGDAAASGIVGRMGAAFAIDDMLNNPMHQPGLRVFADQMPKLGTEFVDETGLQEVRDWIDSMAPDACDVPVTACPPPPPPMMSAAGSSGSGGAAGAPPMTMGSPGATP